MNKTVIYFSLRLLTLAVVCLTFTANIIQANEGITEKNIIDMHCHIACLDEKNGCFISKELRDNFRYPIYIRAMGSSIDALKMYGDGIIANHLNQQIKASKYVSQAVILAMDGVITNGKLDISKTMVYVPNSFVLEQSKKHEHLLYGASINPYRKDALERLEQAKKDGAVLIKCLAPKSYGLDLT